MEEMLIMTVYADSTCQYTEEECVRDNLVDIELPRRIIYEYFVDYIAESMDGTATFARWLEEYTADDTDGLWRYARNRGCEWHRSDEPAEYATSADGIEIEVCPYCEHEVQLKWDINQYGFKAYCPHCGKRLMLCDACQHRFGDLFDDCDWCQAGTCRFNKEGN